MAKKIGLGVVGLILMVGVTVLAADTGYFGDLPKDLTTVVKGILSPQQISVLMNFRRGHAKHFQAKGTERPDLFKTWKQLNLTEAQQKQLLKMAADSVDQVNPYLMPVVATGIELKRKVFEGDPDDPAINQLSAQLGKEMGEVLWQIALMHNQAKSILAADQIILLEQLRSEHGLRLETKINGLPEMAEQLATLWSELHLTPDQADGLAAAHRLLATHRRDQHLEQHNEWKAEIQKILTAEQVSMVDKFHEQQVAQGRADFLKTSDERARFSQDLGLTGEQKIKLVQIALDRRTQIVPAIQDLVKAAANVRDQLHRDTPDRGDLLTAAAILGDAIGRAAGVGAGLMAEVKQVLTTEQTELLGSYINNQLDRHVEHVRIMPLKVRQAVDLIDELGLTADQKDQIVKWIAEKHQVRNATKHHGAPHFF